MLRLRALQGGAASLAGDVVVEAVFEVNQAITVFVSVQVCVGSTAAPRSAALSKHSAAGLQCRTVLLYWLARPGSW